MVVFVYLFVLVFGFVSVFLFVFVFVFVVRSSDGPTVSFGWSYGRLLGL